MKRTEVRAPIQSKLSSEGNDQFSANAAGWPLITENRSLTTDHRSLITSSRLWPALARIFHTLQEARGARALERV